MKSTLILFLLILSSTAQAGFIVAAGASFNGGFESEEKASNDKSILHLESDTGILLEGEIPFLGGFFSVNSSILLLQQDGTSQYVSANNVLVPDVETEATTTMGTIGGRFRFINFKKFKIFMGAGGIAGDVTMKFKKDSFVSNGGTEAQFRPEERASSWGAYLEAGTEYIIDNKNAVRVAIRLVDTKTDDYNRIASNRLDLDYAMLNVSYLFNLDWKFRKVSQD